MSGKEVEDSRVLLDCSLCSCPFALNSLGDHIQSFHLGSAADVWRCGECGLASGRTETTAHLLLSGHDASLVARDGDAHRRALSRFAARIQASLTPQSLAAAQLALVTQPASDPPSQDDSIHTPSIGNSTEVSEAMEPERNVPKDLRLSCELCGASVRAYRSRQGSGASALDSGVCRNHILVHHLDGRRMYGCKFCPFRGPLRTNATEHCKAQRSKGSPGHDSALVLPDLKEEVVRLMFAAFPATKDKYTGSTGQIRLRSFLAGF